MSAASARAQGRLFPRGAVADVVARMVGLLDGDDDLVPIYELERQARAWYFESCADGFPARASGAEPSGGAGNVVHDFGSPDAPELLEVRRVAVTHEMVHVERGGGIDAAGMPATWRSVVARGRPT